MGIDASDDPWTLQLNTAAMHARKNGGNDLPIDPYDALITELQQHQKNNVKDLIEFVYERV